MTGSKVGGLRATLFASLLMLPTSALAEDPGAGVAAQAFAPGSVAAGAIVPLTNAEMSAIRGRGLLEDLLALFEEGNTVSITVDDNPPETAGPDPAPQSITFDNGNIHIFTSASTGSLPGATTGATSVSTNISTSTMSTTHSSSRSLGF